MSKRNQKLQQVLDSYLCATSSEEKSRTRESVLRHYDYLVGNTIRRFSSIPYGVDHSELEQLGRIALWRALENYNPNEGAKFVTYAISAIRRAISRGIRDSSWSKTAAENEKKLNKATVQMTFELGRPPSSFELAEFLDMSEEKLLDMQSSCSRNKPLYIHQPNPSELDSEMSIVDSIPSNEIDHLDRLILKKQASALLGVINELKGHLREAAIMLIQGYSAREIGQAMNVSSSRAGMIVATARERIYDKVHSLGLEHLFSEWLHPVRAGSKPGRLRIRRRQPKLALLMA